LISIEQSPPELAISRAGRALPRILALILQ
jgi:hypothetical protein